MFIKKFEDDVLNNIKEYCNNDTKLLSHYFSLMWYIKSARLYRFFYYLLNIISLITPLVGMALTILFDQKWYSIISSVGTLSISLLNLFQCHKHWKLYRNMAEKIKIVFSDLIEGRITKDIFYSSMKEVHIEDNIKWYKEIMNKEGKK